MGKPVARWDVGNAPLSSCSFGVDVHNRAFQFDPFRPHATAPCRGERRSVVFYQVGPESLGDTPVRSLLREMGFALLDEPQPQAEMVARPGTIMKRPEAVYADLGCGGLSCRGCVGTSLAHAAAEFTRLRAGVEGLPDSARTSEKYRKVMSSLTQYRVPGTPGYIGEVLPQERGSQHVRARPTYGLP